MASVSKFKTLGTGLLATRSKWIKWPKRQLAAGEVAGECTREFTQARVPLWSYTTDRKQIFSGPYSMPYLTGKGVLELWKNESHHLAASESETATESSTVCSMCKLVLALGGVAGTYFIVRWHRNRKLSAAVQRNIAFQQAIVQGVMGAVVEGVKDPVVQAAKQAIEQAFYDVQNVHVQAIKTVVSEAFWGAQIVSEQAINEAIAKAFLEAQNAHALQALEDVPHVPAQNLTTEMVIKAYLAAGNGQEIDLKAFLHAMGFGYYLSILQGENVLKVEDLSRSSEEQLAGYGILQDHIVKLKNGAFYLLDLHKPSFTLL